MSHSFATFGHPQNPVPTRKLSPFSNRRACRQLDRDGDKHIHYDELRHVAYVTLKLKTSELPETILKALWVMLDRVSVAWVVGSK